MPAAMKQLLWICAGILLTFTAMLGAFHLFYDYEYHKIGPCPGRHPTEDLFPERLPLPNEACWSNEWCQT